MLLFSRCSSPQYVLQLILESLCILTSFVMRLQFVIMAIQAHPVPVYPYAPVPPSQGTSMESIPVQPHPLVPVRLPIFVAPLAMHDIIQRFITHFGPNGMGSSASDKVWSLRTWQDIIGLGAKSSPAVGLESVEEGVSGHGGGEKRYGGYGNANGTWRASGAAFGAGQVSGTQTSYAPTTRLRTKKLD